MEMKKQNNNKKVRKISGLTLRKNTIYLTFFATIYILHALHVLTLKETNREKGRKKEKETKPKTCSYFIPLFYSSFLLTGLYTMHGHVFNFFDH